MIMTMNSFTSCVSYCLIVVLIFLDTKAAAQEGPGIVITHPGQDVELLCTVNVTSGNQAAAWLVNNVGPYRKSSLRSGILTGYSATLGSDNLIAENIMMNDVRNGSNHQCVIIPTQSMITLADIIRESNLTILYVAGIPAVVPSVTVDNVTLTLSWGEPFNNFDPIVNYTVSCSGDDTCPPNFTTTDNTTRSYTITNSTPMTNYTFSVVATNSIGSGEAGVLEYTTPATGVPAVVPNVKYDVNINGNNVTLTLSWREPFNNFDPIVSYTVSCSGDVTCPSTTTDNTTRSYTITNLTPMTNYTFSVVATNSIGSGEAGVLEYTTSGVPAMVPNVTVDDNTININGNNVTLTLSWKEPFNNFDPIVYYTVSCSGDVMCPPNFTTTDNTPRSYTITNLTTMTNYTFSVVATNSIGSGEAGVLEYTTSDSCNSGNNWSGVIIGAVVGVCCAVIIIMVITNIMVWIYCFRKRHHTGTSLELHGPTKDTINPAYHTITDDHSKKSVGEPISYYEKVKRPPEEVKMTSNPAYAVP